MLIRILYVHTCPEEVEVIEDHDDIESSQEIIVSSLHQHHHQGIVEEQGAAGRSGETTIEIPEDPTSLSREQLFSYKVKPLQLMCQKLCLNHSGTKNELIDRILGPQVRLYYTHVLVLSILTNHIHTVCVFNCHCRCPRFLSSATVRASSFLVCPAPVALSWSRFCCMIRRGGA